ncbi:uncharacterized protein LOC126680308 [Mercurialis annua]|uniref:uncharacterized protein LOC126680308 n=1 Tax=Mercurialis annua TaxID=3986 RepID=UPI002160083B|nr:uncharacterized protein LOC126680308 [Mercurialis annua]
MNSDGAEPVGGYSTPNPRGGRGSPRSAGRTSYRTSHIIDAEEGDFAHSSTSSASRGSSSNGGRTYSHGKRGNERHYPRFSPATASRNCNRGSTPIHHEYRVKKPSGDGSSHLEEAIRQDQSASKSSDSLPEGFQSDSALSPLSSRIASTQGDVAKIQVNEAVTEGTLQPGVSLEVLPINTHCISTINQITCAEEGDFSHSPVSLSSSSSNGGRIRSHGKRENGRHSTRFSPATVPRHSNHRSTPLHSEYRVKKPSEGGSSYLEETIRQDQSASNATVSQPGPKQQEGFQSDSALTPAYLSSHTASRQVDVTTIQVKEAVTEDTLHTGDSLEVHATLLKNVSQLSMQSDDVSQTLQEQFAKSTGHTVDSGNPENLTSKPFDICPPKQGTLITLKPSLREINRGKRNEIKRALSGQGEILGPGMILLKAFLSMDDQIKIVNICRKLGLGPGGFYQPGYREGAKLLLKMMCLGKNWDPNTSKYGERRPIDGAKPPSIPPDFHKLVGKAMKDAVALMVANNEEETLPLMSPDICITNFYSTKGRLGLHQDKDESEGSLRKGLPVVSFSIGDSGEFLYGDNIDENAAKKVLLESGDVLIFGGKSRHIFHGVYSVHADTAPKYLLDETNFRGGRLNLTFRQY